MRKRFLTIGLAAVLGLTLVGTAPATAAPSYANCTKLHKHYEYGVAKSKKAARKQVNTGHYKPRVSKALYLANSRLDADKDGTACEVSR